MPFQFRLPEGKRNFTSKMGCFMTIILFILIVFFGTMQSIKLLTFDETDIMVSQRDAYYEADKVYSNGLAFTFRLTQYDSETESIEDLSIGMLRPYHKSWGIKKGSN